MAFVLFSAIAIERPKPETKLETDRPPGAVVVVYVNVNVDLPMAQVGQAQVDQVRSLIEGIVRGGTVLRNQAGEVVGHIIQ